MKGLCSSLSSCIIFNVRSRTSLADSPGGKSFELHTQVVLELLGEHPFVMGQLLVLPLEQVCAQ